MKKYIFKAWAKIRPILQKLKWFIVIRAPQLLDSNEFIRVTRIDNYAYRWIRKNNRRVTIIIPTYKDIKLTKNCIQSILQDSHKPKHLKILVVDDGSPAQIQQKLLELNSKYVEVLLKNNNEGYANAINYALKGVKKGDVVILNNDIECFKGWLAHLQTSAYKQKDVGIVGGKLLYPNKSIQFAGGVRNAGAPAWFDHLFRFKGINYPPANIEREVLYLTGACMYIKETALKKVGLFDKNYGMGYEDVDYCLKARGKGFKIIYCPYAVLTHLEGVTRGRTLGEMAKKSLIYFWQKWDKYFNQRKILLNKKLNIIYCLQDTGVGGGHRDVFEHVNRLRKRGHKISVYALAPQPKWFNLDVKVKRFLSYPAMEKALNRQHALKIACWWESTETVWRASLERGLPLYFVQDIESSYYRDNPAEANKVIATYRKEFNFITISSWNQGELRKLDIHSTLISPGIDLKTFRIKKDIKREDNVILAIGRRLHLKNLQLTLDAWKKIMDKTELWLFGIDPSIYHELKSAYPEAKIRHFLRPTDEELVNLYNRASVFVQTSNHEGFCLPALEAMACGCPVITTDSDGNMDFCINNKNCLLVGKNNPDKLAKKIASLIKNTKLQAKLRKEGLKTVKKYEWNKKISELEKFYLKLANRGLYGVDINASFKLPIRRSS